MVEIQLPPELAAEHVELIDRVNVIVTRDGVYRDRRAGEGWQSVELPGIEGRTLWFLDSSDRPGRGDGFTVVVDVADYGVDGMPGWAEPRLLPGDVAPEFVVIASRDGEQWHVVDLDHEFAPDDWAGIYSIQASVSGDRLLVYASGDVTVHDLS